MGGSAVSAGVSAASDHARPIPAAKPIQRAAVAIKFFVKVDTVGFRSDVIIVEITKGKCSKRETSSDYLRASAANWSTVSPLERMRLRSVPLALRGNRVRTV